MMEVSFNRKTGFKLNYRKVVNYKNDCLVCGKSTVKDNPGGQGYNTYAPWCLEVLQIHPLYFNSSK